MTPVFNGIPKEKIWFFDNVHHVNGYANQITADFIYQVVQELLLRPDQEQGQGGRFYIADGYRPKDNLSYLDSKDLQKYIADMRTACGEEVLRGGRTGCIVMNCNPFTLGHRYLIEIAAKQVDTLLIFVVKEDKSAFKFQDRFNMVCEGTKDISNVHVLPSGDFMISMKTFPGYFSKAKLQDQNDQTIDSTQDVLLFARMIAPALNISIRFAGEEPFDKVTALYNKNMKRILPRYGIQFVEIPRKRTADASGQIISASSVRTLLENKDYQALQNYVPDSTLKFLMKKYWTKNILP